ncbi:MAG: LD-carboxypeptidase [Bacteroidales bacterium]|nr:LD-carboxypeptidase [Bacteroidales bacterium]
MTDRRAFLKQTGVLTAMTLASASGLKAGALAGQAAERTLPGTAADSAPSGRAMERILPARLKEGGRIGLVTPGSPVSEEQLTECIVKLEAMGFRTTYMDSVLSEYGYFAGRDQERADELMEMFTREDVDAIWCVRGGYGSIRILDLLDYELIRRFPKVFMGYSDITALLTAINQETGLVTFHGPVGISDFNRFSKKSIQKVLLEPEESYKYPYRREKGTRNKPEFDPYTLNGGTAEGLLTGGNISVLDSMIGTRFEPDFENRMVYLEEVDEKTYRVDKMVFHLLSGTNLKDAAGIVMGVFGDCNVNEAPSLSLKEALDDLLKPLGIPVSYGLSFGHIKRMVTIPTGIRAALDADKNSFRLLEPAVV